MTPADFTIYMDRDEAFAGDKSNGHVIKGAFDAKDATLSACQTFWDMNDGWEWMRDGCTLYSVDDHGNVLRHEIGAPDFDPVFYVPYGTPEYDGGTK